MPRCMINAVRGYRNGKYWGGDAEADRQNVMMTRSGLLIRTVPAQRQINMPASQSQELRWQHPLGSGNLPPQVQRDSYRSIKDGNRKSMSSLSFVTRFGLIKEGIPLNFATDSHDGEDEKAGLERNEMLSSQLTAHNSHGESDSDSDVIVDDEDDNFLHPDILQSQALLGPFPSSSGNNSRHISHVCVEEREDFNQNMRNGNSLSLRRGSFGDASLHSSNFRKDGFSTGNLTKVVFDSSRNGKGQRSVLLRCISPGEVVAAANAAAALVTLATGKTPVATRSQPNPVPRQRNACTTKNTSVSHEIDFLKAPNITSLTDGEDDDSSSFTSQSSLDEASMKHDEAFQLDLNRFQMESHAYTTDANGNHIHRCTICDKVFTVFSAFKAHVNTHVRHKNRCNVCGKIFSRSWLLKGHMRTHTGERPYMCTYSGCEKKFADKSNLRSHMLIHTVTEKSYICMKCKRAFAQKRYLHKHKLEVCKI